MPTTSTRTGSSLLLATSALSALLPPLDFPLFASTPPPSGEPQKSEQEFEWAEQASRYAP